MKITVYNKLFMGVLLMTSSMVCGQTAYQTFTSNEISGKSATNAPEAKLGASDLFSIALLDDVNSKNSDFGGYPLGDKVLYCSAKSVLGPVKRLDGTTGKPLYNLYKANKVDNGLTGFKSIERLKKIHSGPVCSAPNGETIFLTADNAASTDVNGMKKLQLYRANISEDYSISDLELLPFNSNDYSVGHPAVSKDGKILYFASDMPGGMGGVDLYQVAINEDGSFGQIQNLGPEINTSGNEFFPWVGNDGMLFFSSNGHGGLGGLDVFVIKQGTSSWGGLTNLGSSLNSSADDFAFVLLEDGKSGYFSSNRETGKGDDDIYRFDQLKPFVFGVTIEGIAKDADGNILDNATVNLLDSEGNLVATAVSGTDGNFNFIVERDQKFVLEGSKPDYFDGSSEANTTTSDEMVKAELVLEKDPGIALGMLILDKETSKPLEGVRIEVIDNLTGEAFADVVTDSEGDFLKGLAGKRLNDRVSFGIKLSKEGYFPLEKTFNHGITEPGVINVHSILGALELEKEIEDLSILINPINFDLGKYAIRKDAAVELDKIVAYMNKYPNMVVELGAHTDCRGSKRSNESLSDKRAKASAAYIQSRITNPERITGKGYGEAQLINDCGCEGAVKSDCSEEEHAKNRRTEFKVISTGDDKVKVVD